MNQDQEHCADCGARIDPHDQFCSGCGAPVAISSRPIISLGQHVESHASYTRSQSPEEMLRFAEDLPVGTFEIDIDDALSEVLQSLDGDNAEQVLREAVEWSLPPEAQRTAGTVARQLLAMLQHQAEATGSTVPQLLRELADSQATLRLEVTEQDGQRQISMKTTSRLTEDTIPSALRVVRRPGGMGCRFVWLCLIDGAAVLALGAACWLMVLACW